MLNGQVLADEVMPRFAIMLERHFGANASEKLKTLGGAWNVLKNNITLYFDQAQKSVNVNKTLAFVIRTLGKNIGYYEKLRELNSDYYRRLADYQENLKLTNLSKSAKKQRDAEGKWLDETGKQVIEKENEIIKKSFLEKEKVYENKIKREADTNLEVEGLQKNHEKNMANIKRDSQIKTDEELYKLELIRAEKRLEIIKNTAESVNNLIQKSLHHLIFQLLLLGFLVCF